MTTVQSIPVRREHVNVAVLISLATEVMQRQAKEFGITLMLEMDDNVPETASLDRHKVAWVVTSLVGSAIRHVRAPGGRVDVHAAGDGSMLAIAVRDDGPGIPPERLHALLDREGWRPGGALALLLAEDIAVAHGGRVEVESQTARNDHYTRVVVTFAL